MPPPFGFGVEYKQQEIDAALSAPGPTTVRHVDNDGQGHGTRVAGIAAGNGFTAGNNGKASPFVGVAPAADIIVVARRAPAAGQSFGRSDDYLAALQYIFTVAKELGRPVVVNMSQGNDLGPHDGTSLLERGIDNFLSKPGRSVVKSAGNDAAAARHATGRVAAGRSQTITVVVPDLDATPDTVDIWYPGPGEMELRITPPHGTISAPFPPKSKETRALANSKVYVDSVVNYQGNGDNRIYVQLLPGTAPNIDPGEWTLTLTARQAGDCHWHAWIERGDAVPTFKGPTCSLDSTISEPGTAKRVISVGSYITKGDHVGELSTGSSRGPTRDGRMAPTLAAPGQKIMSAMAGAGPMQYQSKSGTSMAAPHVAGTIALMLAAEPKLRQNQIIERLAASARRDAGTGPVPNNAWGCGRLDADKAVGPHQ